MYVHLDKNNGHPPATEIIIQETDKKSEDYKPSIVLEHALKCWLVDLRLRGKPSHFLGECLNSPQNVSVQITATTTTGKKRHFDGSFKYL